MRKLLGIILVLSGACFGQSVIDGFGGLSNYSNGAAAPVAAGNPLSLAGTVSQTGTTKTFTPTIAGATSGTCALGATAVTFSGKRLCPGEPMITKGTGTAMDYTYSASGATAGMDVIASMTTTAITLTAAASVSHASPLSATLTDGHVYPATVPYGVTTRTGFISPLNHIFFFQSVGAATISTNGATKFGSSCAAYAGTMAELIAQGFGGPGMDSDGSYDPTAAGSCGSNPKHPYMYEVVGFSGYLMANLGSYMAQAVKDMNAGTDSSYGCPLKRPQADYFDPNFPTFATGYLNGGSNGSDFTSVNRWKSPYNVAVMFDDTGVYNMAFNSGDTFPTLPRGHTDCNSGMLVMATSPLQAYNNTNPYNSQPEVYADPLVYSKVLSDTPPASCPLNQCSLPDLARNTYGTIGAMNTAIGSSYTTFGSSGTCSGYTGTNFGWCASSVAADTIGTGDGVTTVFPFTLSHHSSVSIHSIQILIAGGAIGGDRGTGGTIGGTGISAGTINYSTGVGSITFAVAPPSGAITANYVQNGWGLGSGLMDEDGQSSFWGHGSAGSYTVTTITPPCQTIHAYTINQTCIDATSVSQQIATTSGTTGGVRPAFSSIAGSQTVDGGVTWSSEGAPLAGTGGDYAASTVNANAAIFANAVLNGLAGKFLNVTKTALLGLFPGSLDQCTDEMGVAYSPARQPVLQAAQQYCDTIFAQLLGTFSDANALDKLRFTTQTYTGPINNYQNFSTQQSPNPCTPGAPSCVATQIARGQAWFSLETLATSTPTFNGNYQITGEEWWATGDPFQGISWGLQTQALGNFFDGVEDVTGTVPCSPPNAAFNCGGEGSAAWNGSNAIYGAGMIQAGNLLWEVAPAGGGGGGNTVGGTGLSGSFSIGVINAVVCGPPTYPCSRTDLNIAPVGGLIAVPPQMGPNTCLSGSLVTCGNLAGVNTIVTDPDFGNPIARMTDANSHPSRNTFQTSDSPETQIWNCTGVPICGGNGPTYIVLKATGGVKFVFQFNPATMTTSTTGVSLGTVGGTISPAWARKSPYRMFGLQGTQVSRYDFTPGTLTFTKTLLFDANQSTCLANPINGASPYNVTSEGVLQPAADDNSFGIEFSNAGGQDTAIHYVFYTASTGDCWVVNTSAGNVTHNGVLVGSLTTGAGTFTMHEAHTAQSPSYALLTPATCLVGPCSVGNTRYQNLTTSLVGCPLTTTCTGEGAAGFTEYLSGTGTGNWHIRPFNDFQNLTLLWITNPALIPPTLNTCNETQHASWNANSGADAEAIIASYGGPGPGGISCSPFVSAWTNEIIGLFQGTTPIRRFAHNFSSGFNVQFDPAFALGQASQDGRFLAFSSDWLGTLGSNPPTSTFTCVLTTTCRADVFVVKLQ